jgi:hypothetical protein
MPHDKNGKALQVGDEVLIRAKVEQIWPDATTCNAQFRTLEKMTPANAAGDLLTLNCNQVEKIDVPATDVQPAAPAAETDTVQV